jgi:hypothetical protein
MSAGWNWTEDEKLAARLMVGANGGDTLGLRFWLAPDNPVRELTIKDLAAKAREIEHALPSWEAIEPLCRIPSDPAEAQREYTLMSLERGLRERAATGDEGANVDLQRFLDLRRKESENA